jgi:hypothetical protein
VDQINGSGEVKAGKHRDTLERRDIISDLNSGVEIIFMESCGIKNNN